MARPRVHSMALLLLKGLFMAFVVAVELLHSRSFAMSNVSTTSTQKHAENYCSMYGICAHQSDGITLNCQNSTPVMKPDALLSSKLQSLYPTIIGNICCTPGQFDTLHGQVQRPIPFLIGFPSCLRNFLNIFYELACSPNQSLFINVTYVVKVNNTLTVNGLDYFITERFGQKLFSSCKEVKFGTMNARAIDFIGGGAQTYQEWLTFMGRQAEPCSVGSPYSVRFQSMASPASGMESLNVSDYSCGDTSLGCSYGDCPSSPMCCQLEPPASHEKGACSVKIGTLKLKCIELSLAIIYVILVLSFFVWGYLSKKMEKKDYF